MGQHGDPNGLRNRRILNNPRGKPRGFGAEQKIISRLITHISIVIRGVPCEGKNSRAVSCCKEIVVIIVDNEAGNIVVVEAGALEMGVGKVETEGFDKVKGCARAGCQTNCRACISRDARFIKNDIQHPIRILAFGRT